MADILIRARLDASEAETGLSRLSTAYERLERREPTLALREARSAMGALGAEAFGVSGTLGRLVTTLGAFGAGTPLALGIVGLVAAFQKWNSYVDGLNDKFLKLQQTLARTAS